MGTVLIGFAIGVSFAIVVMSCVDFYNDSNKPPTCPA